MKRNTQQASSLVMTLVFCLLAVGVILDSYQSLWIQLRTQTYFEQRAVAFELAMSELDQHRQGSSGLSQVDITKLFGRSQVHLVVNQGYFSEVVSFPPV